MRRLLVGSALAAALLWVTSFLAVVSAAGRDSAAPADAIVVLGAAQYNGQPSPVFRARLDHAAELWRRGVAPLVIVTGGVGRGDSLSEASVGRNYLLRSGLPDSVLLVEATGRATAPSMRAAATVLRAAGGSRAVLVSDGFHMLRLVVVARRFRLTPFGSPAPQSPIRSNWRRQAAYFLAESLKAPVAFLVTRS
jgi:uncharacterized SAM-binding protein YcdF (DUF218 family)